MRYRCTFYFALLPLLASPLAAAADQWIKLKTPHFELYTTAGEKKGREAILYFEQVRSFFLQATPEKKASAFPVRIVAFRSEKDYQPYRVREGALAYYSRTRSRDYIVMQDIVSEHYPAAIHEYTHLIIEDTGLKLPVWLNEGWAEVFSTLRPAGNKARVGEVLPGRAVTLLTSKWIDLDALTSVGLESPLYNERNKAGMFYAESWAFVHMLMLTPEYRSHFIEFVTLVTQGKPAEQACLGAFKKHLWEIQAELRRYLEGSRFFVANYDIKLEKSAETPEVSEASPFESGMVTADLLALVGKKDEARAAYERLARDNSGQPEVEESLGYLAWQSGDEDEARAHFAKALEAGTKNAQMCYQYAALARRGTEGSGEAAVALQRALDLKPDYVDARLQLGIVLMNRRSYPQAIGHLNQIKNISSEQAHTLFSALAYSHLQNGDLEKARENAENAKKWAKDPRQTEEADSMLRYLDARKNQTSARRATGAGEPPPPVMRRQERAEFEVEEFAPANPFVSKEDKLSRVEGVAQKLDCSGETLRFFVLVNGKPMGFEIPDPERVVIKHSGEVKHDFTCGAQKPYHVVVEYAILPDSKAGTAGIVRSLEF